MAFASSLCTKMTGQYYWTTRMCCALTGSNSREVMPTKKNVKSVNNSYDFFCNFSSEKGPAN